MTEHQTLSEFDWAHPHWKIEGSAYLRGKRAYLEYEQDLFIETERTLEFLRAEKQEMHQINDCLVKSWRQSRENKPPLLSKTIIKKATPNSWFDSVYPTARKKAGPAFLEQIHLSTLRKKVVRPIALNEDAIALAISGEPSMALQVIYVSNDEQFYFFDYRIDAFCPTSEDKLKSLLSNMLILCSEACAPEVDKMPLFREFRSDASLESMISKAKVLLEVDAEYFERHGLTVNRRAAYTASRFNSTGKSRRPDQTDIVIYQSPDSADHWLYMNN